MTTPNKALSTPATGALNGAWGPVLNANFTAIDAVVGGTQAVAITVANVTLSASEALNLRYACTGALTGNRVLIFPASVGGFWVIDNQCSGAFTLSARSGAGAAIVIPQGGTSFVTSDGTTMQFADSNAATGQSSYAVDTGAADVYVITPPQAVTLKAGTTVFWRPTNTNTGACTLAASGTAATAIKTLAGADPIAGALADDGVYISTYDGTVWRTAGLGAANFGLYSADAGAAAGPTHDLFRDSATPAASDVLGEIPFRGRDSGAGINTYARAYAVITDPTAASEDGEFRIDTVVAGTEANRVRIGAGFYTPNATGGDKGVDTVNAQALYNDGIPVGALVTLTAAASLTLDYPSLVPGLYDIYFNNIVLATSGNPFVVRLSAAAVFLTANYSYQVNAGVGSSGSFVGTDALANGASILVLSSGGNTAAANISGRATLIVGGATAGGTSINGVVNFVSSTGSFVETTFGGRNTTASQIDGIRFLDPTPGNLTSGSISIFRRL